MIEYWLVVTDLDGTLLNHHDYSVDAALPRLKQLQQQQIPVILNTSKTFQELRKIVRDLNIPHPFIAENGSVIYVPEHYFMDSIAVAQKSVEAGQLKYHEIRLGIELDTIQNFIHQYKPDAVNFIDCALEQAIEITGLTRAEALAARERHFSVPLMFADAEQERQFSAQAQAEGFGTLKGGRFLHVQGAVDKAQALKVLKQLFSDNFKTEIGVLVLGDGANDLTMLEQADIAVVVHSPSSRQIELVRTDAIYTQQQAPEGWVEGVDRAFELIQSRYPKQNKIQEQKNGR